VPPFGLSRLVRQHGYKVVVAGEGADEVFGGYNIFKEAKVRRFWAKQPASTWRPRLLERLYPYVFTDPARARHFLQKFYAVAPGDLVDPLFSHRIRWRSSGKNTMFLADALLDEAAGYDPFEDAASRLPADFASRTPLAQAQTLEMDVFLSNYLLSSQGDRVGMAHSVEGRVPFLDHRVIEFAFGLPDHWKIRGLDEKHILKRLGRRYLPPSITDRPKQPYRAPVHEALRTGLAEGRFEHALARESLERAGLFSAKKVDLLLRRLQTGGGISEVQGQAVMGILTTQLLHHRFVDHSPGDVAPREPDRAIRRGCEPPSTPGAGT
jgi:asparagine synthase (glutamine-hydrolysing)